MRFLVLIFMFISSSYAQHSSQPEKESSNDLRTGLIMFSIEELAEERLIWLERTAGYDYFLRMKAEDEEKIQKVSTKQAKQLDMEFATKFLKLMYELPASAQDCAAMLRLNMKGEGQEVCGKDDKKTQEMRPFVEKLRKLF